MCDLNLVSGFLTAGDVALIATFVILGIGIANSASFFAAAANIPLMVAVIVSTALAIAMYTAALVALDNCATGPCLAELQGLRDLLVGLLATLALFAVSLVALAVLAPVPFAGAVAIGSVIALFSTGLVGVIGLLEFSFAQSVQTFNTCLASSGSNGLSGAVEATAYIAFAAAVLFTVGLGIAGKVPWHIKFEW